MDLYIYVNDVQKTDSLWFESKARLKYKKCKTLFICLQLAGQSISPANLLNTQRDSIDLWKYVNGIL